MSDDAGLPGTILVPLDLTPAGDAKIPVVEEYAHALGAEVLLLHVLKQGTVDPTAVLRSEAVARTYLDTVAARLRNSGLQAEGVLRSGAPAATIVQEALVRNVCLIVLGTNVRSTLTTAVVGSVADSVARAAPCPVLLVQPRADGHMRTELRCFQEDSERAGVLVQRSMGVRTIEVARIVGSVGRCKELGPDFRPPPRRRRKGDEDRFNRVRSAVERGSDVPPIEVYKLGFGYYVLDGHHRVANALMNGQVEIDARVTEYLSAGDEQAPERFAARRAFERATELTEVGGARADTYVTLLDEIEAYRRDQHLEELPLAARRWFMQIFRPMWLAVRSRQIAAEYLPGDRSADVIARVAAWRRVEAPELPWDQALDNFVRTLDTDGASTSSSRNG